MSVGRILFCVLLLALDFSCANTAVADDAYTFCSTNYAGTQTCFDSLDAAEQYMRQEPPAGPSGRRLLELSSGPTFSGTTISFGYSVKPRGPAAFDEGYYTASQVTNANPSGYCACTSTGAAACFNVGSFGDGCPDGSGQCKSCVGSDAGIQAVLSNPAGRCGFSAQLLYDYPDPPDFSTAWSGINGLTFPANNGIFRYQNNGDDSQFPIAPLIPFNKILVQSWGTTQSNGTCTNIAPQKRWDFQRNQRFECDAGLTPLAATTNAQNYYAASQVTPISKICRSNATGTVIARMIPTDQTCHGDPCIPGNGSQVEHEVDYSFGSFALERHYNSLRLANTNSYLGPSWQSTYDGRLLIPSGTTSAYVLLLDKKGNIERFDKQTTPAATYRSINTPGSVLTWTTVSSTTTWQLKTATSELSVFSSAGVLLSTQSLDQPDSMLTFAYGPAYSGTGGLLVPAGAIKSVTDVHGRVVSYSYAAINSGPVCSQAGMDPACMGIRLVSVTFPDNKTVAYDYDTAGNLAGVTFPDQNGREYVYNESANICPASIPSACSAGTPPSGGFPHLLTGIYDVSVATGSPVATRFSTYQYDFRGRVVSSSQAGGSNQLTIAYPTADQAILNFAYGSPGAGGMQKTINYTTVQSWFRKESTSQDLDPVSGVQRLTQFFYDSSGRLQTKTDPRNYQRTYEYANGLDLTATTEAPGDPSQRRVETDWNGSFNVPSERRIKNNAAVETKTDWYYNSRGQVLARCEYDPADTSGYVCDNVTAPPVNAKVRRWTFTYCDAISGQCPIIGLLLSVDGPRTDVADVTNYAYYPTTAADLSHYAGDLQTVTNALNQTTTYVSYDKNGRVTRMQDANGVFTDMTYHSRGWLLTRTVRANANGAPSAQDATTTFGYDNVGNITKVTQPDGAYLSYGYDAAHRLTTVTDAIGNKLTYLLDAAGNRIKETKADPSNTAWYIMQRSYSQLNELYQYLDQYNVVRYTYPVTGGYDGNGNATLLVEAYNLQTQNSYDPLNRLLSVIHDYNGTGPSTQNATTGYTYDARNNLRSVKDPDNLVTNYTYDGLNNLQQLQSPDTGTTNYTYDSAGNRASQIDARNVLVTYGYDALNRLTNVNYPTSSLNVTYSFDQSNASTGCAVSYPVGRLTRVTDSSGSTTYCYDQRGNVTSKVQVANGVTSTLAYTYTLADRIQSMTYPSCVGTSCLVVTYSRDTAGKITGVSYKPAGSSTSTLLVSNILYASFGPLSQINWSNGRTLRKGLHSDGGLFFVFSSAADGLQMWFGADLLGNVTAVSTTNNFSPPTRGYHSNNLHQLVQVDVAGAASEKYTYNKTGDRLTFWNGAATTNYTYAAGTHRLTSDGIWNYGTDPNGNVSSIGTVSFAYDNRNRMSSAVGGSATMNYNGRGERVKKSVTSNIWGIPVQDSRFVYSESGALLGEYSAAGTAINEIVYADDLPIAVITGGSQAYYLETDHLGTPRVAVDPVRNVAVWKWDFYGNVFGKDLPNEDPDGDGTAFKFNLRFPGQYFDTGVSGYNFHYNYFRDFEPNTGRYLESDPIGLEGGLSNYSYVQSVPLSLIDPLGLKVVCARISKPLRDDFYDSVAGHPINWGTYNGFQCWNLSDPLPHQDCVRACYRDLNGCLLLTETYWFEAGVGALGGAATSFAKPVVAGLAGMASSSGTAYMNWGSDHLRRGCPLGFDQCMKRCDGECRR